MTNVSTAGSLARRSFLRALGVTILAAARVPSAAAGEAQVIIDNFTFAPTPLTVARGTTVTWVNHDDIPHSIVVPKLKVQSHAMDTDQSFNFAFVQAGTYDYICGLHPHMRGQVVVQA